MSPGAFPPSGGLVQELLRRVAALEQRQPTGVGVSTNFGAAEVRATQVGFPAELTSSWDASTGYSWKQLLLSGVSLAAATAPRTGDKAVTPDGDTTLASGTQGWLEPDPQAGGWVFVASASGGDSGATAFACGWVAGLTASDCLEVELLSAAGRCGCDPVSASSTFLLTSGDGATWTYPGPADPACADCADGSPESWRLTLAGGTTDFAPLNGTYTVTRSSGDGCVWEAASGGVTATWERSGTGWTVTVTDGSAEVVYTATSAGCCSALTLSVGSSTGSGTTPTATTTLIVACPGTLLVCGTMYAVSLTTGCDGPCLTLTPAGGGSAVTAVRESCGTNSATFAVGDPTVCTGDTACAGPAANVLRIRIRWALCGWDGPGWYCVRDCGTADDCLPVELVEGDQYDATIEICSGPYADEAAATAACGPVPAAVDLTYNADARTFPGTYTVTATGATVPCGGSAAASGTASLPYGGVVGGWHVWQGSGLFSVTNAGSCGCATYTDRLVYWRLRVRCVSSAPDYWETELAFSCDGATWQVFDSPSPSNIDSPANYVLDDPGVAPAGGGGCPGTGCAFAFALTG